jgi:molybdate transport system ATP-binding protein
MVRRGSAVSLLEARIRVRRTPSPLSVDLDAEAGDVVAVIGPNGAGKTTLLRALAGLVPLHDSSVRFDGETWNAPDNRTAWTPQQRNTGLVFQQHLLFPHLDALDNVAFGLRCRGTNRREARMVAQEWLDRMGVGALASRRPDQLSGGQAQRVAIARALVTRPGLLLLDEPLAGLDVGVAMALRLELAAQLRDFGGVGVLVTHDAIDSLTLATKVVVLDDGEVAQSGTPQDVARRPRTEHVARLVGLNVLRGHSAGTTISVAGGGGVLITTTAFTGEVFASFSPSAVTLTEQEPVGSARNRWQGVVRSVVPHGAAVRVHLDSETPLICDLTPASAARLALAPGREVWAAVKATEVEVYGATVGPASPPLPCGHV